MLSFHHKFITFSHHSHSLKLPFLLHLGAKKAHHLKPLSFLQVRLGILNRYLNIEDFPHPVGIPTVNQTITGSIQAVFSTCISECDMKNEVRLTNPQSTADGGTLRAFPICLHPCIIVVIYNKYHVLMCISNAELTFQVKVLIKQLLTVHYCSYILLFKIVWINLRLR